MIRNKLRTAVISALFMTVPTFLHAKNAEIKRIELEKTSSNDYVMCAPIGERGLILATTEDEKQKNAEKKHKIWTLTKYDTLLNSGASVDINVKKTCIKQCTEADGKFYLVSTNCGLNK